MDREFVGKEGKSTAPLFGQVRSERVSRYFFKAGLINIVAAALATLPVLVPQLGLPLKLEVWPGTWMVVAYFVFLIAGVMGTFVWCLIYFMLPKLYGKDTVSDFLALTQLVTFEIAVYGIAAMMGIEAGYWGGTLYHDGYGQVVITRIISWVVIPVGTLIVVALLSTITGIVNLLTATNDGSSFLTQQEDTSRGRKRLVVMLGLSATIAATVGIEILLVFQTY